MLIIKVIEIGHDIKDPIALYTNFEINLLAELKSNYEGKCYAGGLIRKILRILQLSDCQIVGFDKTYGHINLQMEVETEIYERGSIITGCRIIEDFQANRGMIFAENDDVVIAISTNDIFQTIIKTGNVADKSNDSAALEKYVKSLKIGQKIPVRVKQSLYSIGSSKVSLSAIVFKPNTTSFYYKIDACDASKIAKTLENTIIEQKIYNEMRSNEKSLPWSFFEKILYPYKNDYKSLPSIDIFDLPKSENIIICCNPRISPLEHKVELCKEVPKGEILSNCASEVAIISILQEYQNYLILLREMVHIYSFEEIKNHMNLWTYLNDIKQ